MAQRETLRDARYQIVGYVETASDGRKTLYDPQYRILGYYDPQMDRTYNPMWQPVAQGDLLLTLLRR